MKQTIRKFECIVPPLLVCLTLLAVYRQAGLWPFGENTLAWGDMGQQIAPLMMEFRDAVAGNGSLLYSRANAGGMNFWGVLFYYLSSPFSFLSVFFEPRGMLFFMNILTLVKIAACAQTAWLFFRFRFPALDAAERCALSTAYAFCGYTMMFYQITGWLDAMILFPLLLWSFLRVFDGGPVLFFTIMLALSVIVNFYISYCTVLFLIFSSGLFLAFGSDRKEARAAAARLGIGAAAAMLLSAFVWLPAFYQYLDSARTAELSAGLTPLLAPVHTTWAFLFCTAALFAALPFVFTPSNLRERSRLPLRILFLLLLIPSLWEPVNRVWHTGDYQAFPIRYGFLTVFTGLVLTAEALLELKEQAPLRQAAPRSGAFFAAGALLLPAVAGSILFKYRYHELTTYTRRLSETEESYSLVFFFFAAAAVSYFFLCFMVRNGAIRRTAFSVLLAALVVLEGGFHSFVYLGSASRQTAWFPWVTDLSGRIGDAAFYRVKTESKLFDVNLIGAIGYPTMSHYTSLSGKNVREGMAKLGYSAYWMEIGSHGGTLITDWLLGNRYRIERTDSKEKLPEGFEESVYDNGGYRISRLPFSAPLIAVPEERLNTELPETEVERALTGDWILEQLTGQSSALVRKIEPSALLGVTQTPQENGPAALEPSSSAPAYLTWRFVMDETSVLYFDCFDRPGIRLAEPYYHALRILVNGEEASKLYPTQSSNGLIELGTFHAGERVEITAVVKRPVQASSFGVYALSAEGFGELAGRFPALDLSPAANGWAGSISSETDGLWALLPIPYEHGLSIEINDSPVECRRVFGFLTAVPLQSGQNLLTIRFSPPGLNAGLLISLFGLALLAAIKLAGDKGVERFSQKTGAAAAILLAVLWAGAFWIVYLQPTAKALLERFG